MKSAFVVVLMISCLPLCLTARSLYVNPNDGNDLANGLAAVAKGASGPVKSIAQAVSMAKAGDTIFLGGHLYKGRGEHIGFYGTIAGEPNRPIIVDGQGAIIDGAVAIDPNDFKEIEAGLYCAKGEKLFGNILEKSPTIEGVDAMVGRVSFIFGDKLNRMGRSVKAHSAAWKEPNDLKPGEWTYKQPADNLWGDYFIRIDPAKKLSDYKIEMPAVNSGVQIAGTISHIVFKNITVTHVVNDGFALTSGNEKGSFVDNIVYENIRSIECCDDGFSSHGDCCNLKIKNFYVDSCATGVANAGGSSIIENFTVKNVHGVDVYFLSGDHILKNSRIEVHGNNSPLRIRALTPAHAADYPSWDRCRVEIDNVIFDGSGLPADGSSRVFVEDRSSLVIKGSKLNKMTIVVENDAAAEIRQSALAGGPAYGIEIRPKGKWQADKNFYELGSIKIGETVYDANSFSDYQKATGQDKSSNWNK